jgi:tRNA-2-methylthio-N6-dimethylallyladenosine synthase
MKIHTIALGCQMSVADGLEMSRPFIERGAERASAIDEADCVILTTCTVRDHAEHRAISLIGRLRAWKEEDPRRLLVVAGCAAERMGKEVRRRFPHVDLVVGAKSLPRFPALAAEILEGRSRLLESSESSQARTVWGLSETELESRDARLAHGFVTVMRGCNYSCSYCIVPSVRGREIYRDADEILAEVRAKTAAGLKEVTLLGQTVNSYRSQREGREIRFPELLRLVDAVPSLERLRFMSPHPHFVTAEMIRAMAECRSVCEHLHLPVQSGSDRILKLMRRNYTRASYLEKVGTLRRLIPEIEITTDIIVGFPSETDEDFEETLRLIAALEPSSVYTFKYSARPGTLSAAMEDDVPTAVKEDRLARLNELVAQTASRRLSRWIGKPLQILADTATTGRSRQGFKTRWERPVESQVLFSARAASVERQTLIAERIAN